LTLKLLIDEDFQDKVLVKLLVNAKYDVITANNALLSGLADASVLKYGTDNNRVVLTRNCRDFKALHLTGINHSGIFAVYREANVLKSMSFPGIVKAIGNIEASKIKIANQFIVLNHWNY